MALPTGNLTFHGDASVSTDLWQVNTAGAFSDHPVDGESVDFVDDVEHADVCAAIVSAAPVWRSNTPLMALPCLDFNGSSQYLKTRNNANSANKTGTDLLSSAAFTILASVYVEGITSNTADPYDNDSLLSDLGFASFGIGFKNSSDPHAIFYNYDGNYDEISLPISLNTSYVLMFRHESGNLYASLNGGSETSVASGAAAISGALIIGSNWEPTKFFNGRLGEIAMYNAALTGSNLTDAVSYFTAKWIPAAPSGDTGEWMGRTAVRRGPVAQWISY